MKVSGIHFGARMIYLFENLQASVSLIEVINSHKV